MYMLWFPKCVYWDCWISMQLVLFGDVNLWGSSLSLVVSFVTSIRLTRFPRHSFLGGLKSVPTLSSQ
jgi:hypothetical protein